MATSNEASVREAHSSDAPLPFPILRIKLGPRINENIEYNSYEDAFIAFQQYCASHGYSIVVCGHNKNKKGETRLYNCDRGGIPRDRKNKELHSSKKRTNTGSRKINCPFRIDLKQLSSGKWNIAYKEECHNHEASDGAINHPAHRTKTLNTNTSATAIIKTLMSRMTKVSTIRATMEKDWGILLTKRDIYNMRARIRTEQLGGLTAIQWLAKELDKCSYFVKINTDKDNRVIHLFFAHPECIQLWHNAPDVLLMDATYKTNRFHQPLINICGSLGNNMTPQLALSFVSGEKEADYKWVLECIKELIKKKDLPKPRCFVTDRELALMNALEDMFPDAYHVLCRWHVNKYVVAKTKKYFTILEDWLEFFEAWLAVIDATTEAEYKKKLTAFKKHTKRAVKYVVETWLIWKEKIVRL